MTRTQRIRCNVIAAIAFLIISPFVYLASDRDTPFLRTSGVIVPENPRPGDDIAVVWTAETKRQCSGTVSREIIDSHRVVWTFDPVPARYTESPTPTKLVRNFKLPVQIAPGPARYRSVTRFVCNFTQIWWPIVVEGPPVTFNIATP